MGGADENGVGAVVQGQSCSAAADELRAHMVGASCAIGKTRRESRRRNPDVGYKRAGSCRGPQRIPHPFEAKRSSQNHTSTVAIKNHIASVSLSRRPPT